MFLGTESLKKLLKAFNVISPYIEQRIKNGSYELSLGAQVFQTDSSPRSVKNLQENEKIEIKPGQFALLLTKEYVRIPENKIAFISMKAGVKFKGLVNVSGFHVDPGFEGNLLFSVYNAGPSNIVLSNGTPYFPIWFSELNETQDYKGSHEKQMKIPDDPVEALSQGNLASPNVLSERIDKLDLRKNYTQWLLITLIVVLGGLWLKGCSDLNDISKAVEYGYKKKEDDITKDSLNNLQNSKIDSLRVEVNILKDSLNKLR